MRSEDEAADTANISAKTFGERWNEMYERLVRFKEANGHCLVPNRYQEDKKLGAWVSAQRRHYKILTSGKKESTPMTFERAQKLIDIRFDWSTSDPRHVSWEDRFEQLKSFKKTYGHVQVPMGWNENPSLSNWVSAQRQDYKLLQKGRPSRLCQEKINLLTTLGFVWEAPRGGRRRKLEPLKEGETEPDSPPLSPAEHEIGPSPRAIATAMQQLQGMNPMFSNRAAMLAVSKVAPMQAGLAAGSVGSLPGLTPLQQHQMLTHLPASGAVGGYPMVGLLGANATLMTHPGLTLTEFAMRLHHQQAQDQAIFLDRAGFASLAPRGGFLDQHFPPGGFPSSAFADVDPSQQAEREALRSALAATNKRSKASGGTHMLANERAPSGASVSSSTTAERKREARGFDPDPSLQVSGIKRAKRTG